MEDETTHEVDRIDVKIMKILAEDGRITWRDLAEQVGLSTTPVLRRVNALERAGFIAGYSANLDERKLAGGINVLVSVTLVKQDSEALERFEEQVVLLPEVMSCVLTTGDYDYQLRVVSQTLDTFHIFLTTRLAKIPGVAHVKSSFTLKTVLLRKSPLA